LEAAGKAGLTGWTWPFDGLEDAERAALLAWAKGAALTAPGPEAGPAAFGGGREELRDLANGVYKLAKKS